MKPAAKWTHDCCGKQDYDGEIISISTRYWPRGGGYLIFDRVRGIRNSVEDFPDQKPSAKSSILLRHGEDGDSITLAECSFEADTEEEVKLSVEAWVQTMFGVVRNAVTDALSTQAAEQKGG